MPKFAKDHTVVRPVTLEGIGENGENITFLTTFVMLPGADLKASLDAWRYGVGPEVDEAQRGVLKQWVRKVTSKGWGDEEALAFVVDSEFVHVRMAFHNIYQTLCGGAVLQKN
jgi:hypothetical protein